MKNRFEIVAHLLLTHKPLKPNYSPNEKVLSARPVTSYEKKSFTIKT
jgi:hypothetical protein